MLTHRDSVGVKTRETDKLEHKALLRELPDEVLHVRIREALPRPIEARAEVVHEPLPGVTLTYRASEGARLLNIWASSLEPKHIRIGSIFNRTSEGVRRSSGRVVVSLASTRH